MMKGVMCVWHRQKCVLIEWIVQENKLQEQFISNLPGGYNIILLLYLDMKLHVSYCVFSQLL